MAEKLEMASSNIISENIEYIATKFPNALKEVMENGKLVKKIDFDVLKQELSTLVMDDKQERYQMTWPDKKKSILLANSRINATLRPVKEKSVDFDNTQNLYIEGDNLDVLKLLRETYLGKIKMIYIDPPYNTGNDFVYEDDFSQSSEEYLRRSGQYDDQGNRLFQNTDSNGRFHTDWLNMIYPRLKIAKDLLSYDGAIFISIDDNEVQNLRKICDEIFGNDKYVATFPWRKRTAKSDVPYGISQDYEWILVYAKSQSFSASIEGGNRKYYETPDFPGRPWRIHDMTKQTTASERPNSYFTMINPKNGDEYPCDPNRTWRITKDTFQEYYVKNEIVFPGDYDFLKISKPVARYFQDKDMAKAGNNYGKIAVSTKLPDHIGMSQDGTREIKEIFGSIPFPFPKSYKLLSHLVKICTDDDDIILDFFSGSGSLGHSIINLNSIDNKNRRFILIQLPQLTSTNSEAYKIGFKNICEIGEERIRRVGKKIKEEVAELRENLDIGFRVLKLDSSNMNEVYYNPNSLNQNMLDQLVGNIKEDRTPLDLLFQVMLELGIKLSAKIEEKELFSKKYFVVNESDLVACFDDGINDELVKELAKIHSIYAVFKDSAFTNDSANINCEQIFKSISPSTTIKVV